MKRNLIIAAVVIVVVIGLFFIFKGKDGEPKYITEIITNGDIKSVVSATGTVNAVTTVLVGTQVSGTIKQLYVDYNSTVKKGQLLAQIDPATFTAQVEQARANLMLAEANLEKAQVALKDSKITMERNKILFAKNFIAKSDLDTAETNYLSAEAQIKASQAQIAQAKAALSYAETNLRYTKIISPVSGTVISRNIDVGQTVAASFQTPTLFNIAQDLTKMQIDTNVDEADIGKIKMSQPVEFAVDAYPDITFVGNVSEIRNAPITVQNVVTYDVVIKVANPDKKLKPGMTANVSIAVANKKGVLKVPNASLRLKMSDKESPTTKQKGSVIWMLENKKPKRVTLVTGISDGNHTEVISGDIHEGQLVIVDIVNTNKKNVSAPGAGAPRFIR